MSQTPRLRLAAFDSRSRAYWRTVSSIRYRVPCPRVHPPDQRLVHQRREQLKDLPALGRTGIRRGTPMAQSVCSPLPIPVSIRRNRLGRLQRPAAGEDRQAPAAAPLRLRQQVVAPVDRARSVCWRGRRRPPAAGQQPEAVVQPAARDLLDRSAVTPRRRQLDGQRDAVQPPADAGHRRGVLLAKREPGSAGGGTVANRRTASYCARVSSGLCARRSDPVRADRRLERRHTLGDLARDVKPSRLVARMSARAPVQEGIRQRAAASSRCSQLSRIKQRRLGFKFPAALCHGPVRLLRDPRRCDAVSGTSAGSASGARSTSHTPSG